MVALSNPGRAPCRICTGDHGASRASGTSWSSPVKSRTGPVWADPVISHTGPVWAGPVKSRMGPGWAGPVKSCTGPVWAGPCKSCTGPVWAGPCKSHTGYDWAQVDMVQASHVNTCPFKSQCKPTDSTIGLAASALHGLSISVITYSCFMYIL